MRRIDAVLRELGYVRMPPARETLRIFNLIRLQRARRAFVTVLERRATRRCQCGERPPANLIHWPGGDIRLCVRCTFRASHIANAMGFVLSVEELA